MLELKSAVLIKAARIFNAKSPKLIEDARDGIRTHGHLRDWILSPAPLAGLATLAQYSN